MTSQWQKANQDIWQGIKSWRIWWLLSWSDICLRYRRSVLGPFWITISMAILISAMGFLYGHLFRVNVRNYFPFLAAGMLTWYLISALLMDAPKIFIDSEAYCKQMKLPYLIFVMRFLVKNFIVFLHNIIIIIPILMIYHIDVGWQIFLVLPGLFLLLFNALTYGTLIAMISTRFRDVEQIVVSLIQVVFFMTPIMWNIDILPIKYRHLMLFNPFNYFITLVRDPLMGQMPSGFFYLIAIMITLVGLIVSYFALVKFRRKIIFWL